MEQGTKPRLFALLQLLYDKTDEKHMLNTVELLEMLKAEGYPISRKTLRNDLKEIAAAGIDIVCVKSSPNKYFLGSRVFELPELKLLIDAVLSSRFITKKKSRVLTDKLLRLAGANQKEELERHIVATGRVKADNENIYYIVDQITDAINDRVKVAFNYFEYDGEKKKVYRNDGEKYAVSAYSLFWNEDNYYVVGYCDKHEGVSQFRVDRIDRLEVLEEKAVERPEGFDINDYSNKVFDMFSTGEEVEVSLECKTGLMKYVVDRFGIDVDTRVVDKNLFTACVTVNLSPTFYAWVFQFGGGIRITGPAEAVDGFEEMKRK